LQSGDRADIAGTEHVERRQPVKDLRREGETVRLPAQFSNAAQLPDCELGPARCLSLGGRYKGEKPPATLRVAAHIVTRSVSGGDAGGPRRARNLSISTRVPRRVLAAFVSRTPAVAALWRALAIPSGEVRELAAT
jgi:hypothetical protein